MRLSLIGPGDTKFHYKELLGIPEEKFKSEIEKITKVLADSKTELELLPDKGISIEIARKYKKQGGKKVIASLPKSDKTFGIAHLTPYLNEKIGNKPLFDEIIDTENWFKQDLIKGLLGDAILYLGSSPGTEGELNYAIYLYKIISNKKEGIKINSKQIHKSIIAGKNFTIFVYSPFLINKKLPKETEEYIKKFNIKLVYINNSEELRNELHKFIQTF
jgi:hypothetical protein